MYTQIKVAIMPPFLYNKINGKVGIYFTQEDGHERINKRRNEA